jgi:hypothetical protein
MGKLKILFLVILTFTLTYSFGQAKITISEINYKSDKSMDSEDWIEVWNYGNVPEDLSNWVLQGEMFNEIFQVPPGTAVEAGERIVFARDNTKFLEIFPDVNPLGPFVFRLSGKGQRIRLYDNTNTLFQEVWYRDSIPWSKTADGHGKTLELINPEGNINDGNNWMSYCVLGSPGKQSGNCTAKLIFTEIYTANIIPWDSGDWVELRNTGTVDLDVSKWVFKNRNDSNIYELPLNSIIKPGERFVLNRRDKFYNYYSEVRFFGPFSFGLRGQNEVLKIYDENGKIYNSMFFHNDAPWPMLQQYAPYSIEIIDENASNCMGSNWRSGCWGGSPGKECLTPSVNETADYMTISKVFPNPFNQLARIEAHVQNYKRNESLHLQVYDFTGNIKSNTETNQIAETHAEGESTIRLTFNRNDLPPGIYLYRITQSQTVLATGKMMVVD